MPEQVPGKGCAGGAARDPAPRDPSTSPVPATLSSATPLARTSILPTQWLASTAKKSSDTACAVTAVPQDS